jgi:hypothetical protein
MVLSFLILRSLIELLTFWRESDLAQTLKPNATSLWKEVFLRLIKSRQRAMKIRLNPAAVGWKTVPVGSDKVSKHVARYL